MPSGNPYNFPNNRKPTVSPEKMSSQIKAMETIREWDPIDKKEPEQIETRIREFFDFCIENSLRPGVELLAASLGSTRMEIWQWEQRGGERGKLIKNAKQLISALLEQWSMDGDVNPTTAIWLQKNHFGYQDTVVLQTDSKNPLNELPTKEEIQARIPKVTDEEQDT